MSNQTLPKHLDPHKLADKDADFAGSMPINFFPRFVEALHNDSGELAIELQFFRGEDGFREMTGSAEGQVELECQRCMSAMKYDFNAEFHLGFAYNDDVARSLPKRMDAYIVSPDQSISVTDLIEDDLILNLPQFALHDEGECQVQTEYGSPEEEPVSQGDEKINPFSILAELKKPENDN